uniref:Uncharacterized protein n=1 Tax=Heterorhabditis bacteriophora TaxID=37862 RepID=A0A1I7WKL9_HETBA
MGNLQKPLSFWVTKKLNGKYNAIFWLCSLHRIFHKKGIIYSSDSNIYNINKKRVGFKIKIFFKLKFVSTTLPLRITGHKIHRLTNMGIRHLCAKRFRSVQNYPKPLRKERWESSAKAKASAQESPENRGKNSPVNLHCLKPSNSPSKCIETHQWIGRMRFVRRTAETPTYARSVPQPGCRRLTNHQLLLNWRKSKTNSPGSIPRSSHLTLRQQPLLLYEFLFFLLSIFGNKEHAEFENTS